MTFKNLKSVGFSFQRLQHAENTANKNNSKVLKITTNETDLHDDHRTKVS